MRTDIYLLMNIPGKKHENSKIYLFKFEALKKFKRKLWLWKGLGAGGVQGVCIGKLLLSLKNHVFFS